MKTSLAHLPQQKQEEILAICDTLVRMMSPEMVILFGSYATGFYVEDTYTEDFITYTYISDYDILVVIPDERKAHVKEKKIREQLRRYLHHDLPVQVIVHGIDYLNEALEEGQYFFSDIVKEGILLYDSQRYQLASPKPLSPRQRADISQGYYDKWFYRGYDFLRTYEFQFSEQMYSMAIFSLHQSTECLFNTIELVYTHYKPKTHDLKHLYKNVVILDDRFKVAFPLQTEYQRKMFEVLAKSYIDSRYKLNYTISREELLYLAERVHFLKELATAICREKIADILQSGVQMNPRMLT